MKMKETRPTRLHIVPMEELTDPLPELSRASESKPYVWRSCCFQCDKRFVMFATRAFISLMVIVFCMIQLFLDPDCSTQSLYVGILTTVIGVWLPSPSYHEAKK